MYQQPQQVQGQGGYGVDPQSQQYYYQQPMTMPMPQQAQGGSYGYYGYPQGNTMMYPTQQPQGMMYPQQQMGMQGGSAYGYPQQMMSQGGMQATVQQPYGQGMLPQQMPQYGMQGQITKGIFVSTKNLKSKCGSSSKRTQRGAAKAWGEPMRLTTTICRCGLPAQVQCLVAASACSGRICSLAQLPMSPLPQEQKIGSFFIKFLLINR